MADVHDPETRSYNMSKIGSKNTKPELIVRRFLHSKGFRYRLHDIKFPGKPDLVLRKYKTVIFVNGCFWHGHETCKNFKLPDTNKEKWKLKIQATKHRDLQKILELYSMGWSVKIIWECELKSGKKEATLQNLIDRITTNEVY